LRKQKATKKLKKSPFQRYGGHVKIAVAMSGGVDSSVCADILVRQGHEVMGFTAVMSGSIAEKKNGPAKEVCDYLGIPFHVVDVRREFEQAVIVYFESEYLSGRTPSPCVLCNSIIKFGLLWNRMSELGAERISTGHYVRISKDNDGNVFLLRGIDTVKDQSYFLHRLNREQLTRAIFPLGSMLKKEVYEYARSKNIPFGGGKESQELSFVEEGKTGEWIESRNPDASVSGDIVSVHGG